MDTLTLPFTQVDAFTSRPFAGNPAAVLILAESLTADSMQRIASEMNLSETAFTGPTAGGGRWLRWFTPTAEVPLCGHATLATAHVLFSSGAPSPLQFESASGTLRAERIDDRIRLDFPADAPVPAAPPQGLLEALGCRPGTEVRRARNVWLVRVDTSGELAGLRPRYSTLAEVDVSGALGVAVTAAGDTPTDFVSRFFAPWVGVDEDPVTGVAHTVLTPYWTRVLGARPLHARQLSTRGGDLTVELHNDRVLITGSAVTVAQGHLHRPG